MPVDFLGSMDDQNHFHLFPRSCLQKQYLLIQHLMSKSRHYPVSVVVLSPMLDSVGATEYSDWLQYMYQLRKQTKNNST